MCFSIYQKRRFWSRLTTFTVVQRQKNFINFYNSIKIGNILLPSLELAL